MQVSRFANATYLYGMMEIDGILISEDIKKVFFVCNLDKCKGACCVEGDLGAPLEEDELPKLEEIYDRVKPYMSNEGIFEVNRQGKYVLDIEGDYSTPTIKGKECAYAVYSNGILKCAIEQAYREGKIDWPKPVSCHLYPIRILKKPNIEAINYDKWEICSPACSLGKSLGILLYKFLKEPLIRKYGADWYEKLVLAIESED